MVDLMDQDLPVAQVVLSLCQSIAQRGFSSQPSFDHHVSTQVAFEKLHEIIALQGHVFWPEPDGGYANDGFSCTVPNTLTHNLVTDGFLATVAAANDAKLATLDKQLVRIFPDLAVLVTETA